MRRPAPHHLLQPLAGESTLPSTAQLTQEAAEDVEQCSPYLEHTCEDGHKSTVACSLYTLPVVLKDAGGMPRSPSLGMQMFFLKVFQEPPLCAVLWPSLQHLIIGLQQLPFCSFHPLATLPLQNGTLPFNTARLYWDQQVRKKVCLSGLISICRCTGGQFYDNLIQQCFSIKCGFLYKNVGGR